MDTDVARALKTLERAGRPLGFLSALDDLNLIKLIGKSFEQLLNSRGISVACQKNYKLYPLNEDHYFHKSLIEVLDSLEYIPKSGNGARVYSCDMSCNTFLKFKLTEVPNEDIEEWAKYAILAACGVGALNVQDNWAAQGWIDQTNDGKVKDIGPPNREDKKALIWGFDFRDELAIWANFVVVKEKSAAELNKEVARKKALEDKERAKLAELLKKYPDVTVTK